MQYSFYKLLAFKEFAQKIKYKYKGEPLSAFKRNGFRWDRCWRLYAELVVTLKKVNKLKASNKELQTNNARFQARK